ncbi:type VII secretion protein EssB [Virgibacillus necropolis]|nr:type VII secretion protein EssB [Virgibacillus necropolis]
MEQKEPESYLEKQTEGRIKYNEKQIEFSFHRQKLKLRDEMEIELLKSINPELNKTFTMTDDLLMITIDPPESYMHFDEINVKSNQAKWRLAYNLIQKVQQHNIHRLKLIISPENIMFDSGLAPYLLHYGVRESIPPYEDEENRLWNETKALVATITDNKYEFSSYLDHHETINLSKLAKEIMESKTYEQLVELVEKKLKEDEKYETSVIHIPKKKWKIQRFSILGLILLLIPALIYTAFASFFKIPETNAYVEANKYFLQDNYSSVINTLEGYEVDDMPYVVQYQLVSSYVVNESLTKEQKENVQNTITLQSDEKYFLYWIDIGRGNYQQAVDTARLLEDRDLIVYGLLKLTEAIKANEELSGKEREEKLNEIEREITDYKKGMEEQAKEETVENQGEPTNKSTSESKDKQSEK